MTKAFENKTKQSSAVFAPPEYSSCGIATAVFYREIGGAWPAHRNKLEEEFLTALCANWRKNGTATIAEVCEPYA